MAGRRLTGWLAPRRQLQRPRRPQLRSRRGARYEDVTTALRGPRGAVNGGWRGGAGQDAGGVVGRRSTGAVGAPPTAAAAATAAGSEARGCDCGVSRPAQRPPRPPSIVTTGRAATGRGVSRPARRPSRLPSRRDRRGGGRPGRWRRGQLALDRAVGAPPTAATAATAASAAGNETREYDCGNPRSARCPPRPPSTIAAGGAAAGRDAGGVASRRSTGLLAPRPPPQRL